MTDLTLAEAIAEVKSDLAHEDSVYDDTTDIILKAVASGDLIPKADAELPPQGYSDEKCALAIFLSPSLAEADTWGWDDRGLFRAALAELQALRDAKADLFAKCCGNADYIDAAESEFAKLQAQVERLTGALRLAIGVAESWIHDELVGTGLLDDALAELDPARAALTEGAAQSLPTDQG